MTAPTGNNGFRDAPNLISSRMRTFIFSAGLCGRHFRPRVRQGSLSCAKKSRQRMAGPLMAACSTKDVDLQLVTDDNHVVLLRGGG